MRIKLFAILVLLPALCMARDLSESFQVGKGSTYILKMATEGTEANVSIYVTDVKTDKLSIEYFMTTSNSLIPMKMWQQFELIVQEGSPVKVSRGFVQTREIKKPEEMTSEYLQGTDGVQVNDFLFASKEELEKNKIGEETIEVPAGKTKAVHYRTSNNGQTIDYWISDEAKPLGLVKLVSTGGKEASHNYSLELSSLMKKVKAYIDPVQAVPLTKLGKSFLAKPHSVR